MAVGISLGPVAGRPVGVPVGLLGLPPDFSVGIPTGVVGGVPVGVPTDPDVGLPDASPAGVALGTPCVPASDGVGAADGAAVGTVGVHATASREAPTARRRYDIRRRLGTRPPPPRRRREVVRDESSMAAIPSG
ncbi:hypothetical protein [Kitasatospora sp. NPDC017646]|uniref:hypothetical protein n=1 Tax=Kitasatospora sp. NPDC017646 TaxID=3364024 RepID=UPI0037AAB3FB